MQAPSRRGSCPAFPLFSEELESRTMLSVTIQDQQLVITGTDADDVIILKRDADDSNTLEIDVNDDPPTFMNLRELAFEVHSVFVQGLDGNDDIEVDESNGRIRLGLAVDAGPGDDTVVGGSGS